MKRANNFQIAEIQPQGAFCLAFACFFFANFSLVLLINMLLIKKHVTRRSGVFIVDFEHISHLVLVFLLLTLNM